MMNVYIGEIVVPKATENRTTMRDFSGAMSNSGAVLHKTL